MLGMDQKLVVFRVPGGLGQCPAVSGTERNEIKNYQRNQHHLLIQCISLRSLMRVREVGDESNCKKRPIVGRVPQSQTCDLFGKIMLINQ
jgi:hypothetical protein